MSLSLLLFSLLFSHIFQYVPGIVILFMGSTTSNRRIKSLADWERWEGSEYIPDIGHIRDQQQGVQSKRYFERKRQRRYESGRVCVYVYVCVYVCERESEEWVRETERETCCSFWIIKISSINVCTRIVHYYSWRSYSSGQRTRKEHVCHSNAYDHVLFVRL